MFCRVVGRIPSLGFCDHVIPQRHTRSLKVNYNIIPVKRCHSIGLFLVNRKDALENSFGIIQSIIFYFTYIFRMGFKELLGNVCY